MLIAHLIIALSWATPRRESFGVAPLGVSIYRRGPG